MTAQPAPSRRSSPAGEDPLLAAQRAEADAAAKAAQRGRRIDRALERRAASVEISWTTPDEREAELRVFYLDDEELEMLAAELVRLDGRQATLRQRVDLEEAFEAELFEFGELWHTVAGLAHARRFS